VKKRRVYRLIFVIILFMITSVFLYFYLKESPKDNLKKMTFFRLDKIRMSRKNDIIDYFKKIESLASEVKNDEKMLSFFHTLKDNDNLSGMKFDYEIDKYFVENYGYFYDILFVDINGYVFHSIRQEADYHTNLFEGSLSDTDLAKKLRNSKKDHYIDYKFYPPSDEPASFFATLISKGEINLGWIILQHPINSINMALSKKGNMGRTGEVYLVNSEKIMLSESRFLGDSTILKRRVDTAAVKEALEKSVGERIIIDYRGIKVFSSFEKFTVSDTDWIIIAEIDEAEVITDHYKKHKKYFESEIMKYLESTTQKKRGPYLKRDVKRVDMNEFEKAIPGTVLETSGISTCTGVTILYPGKFAYLAHISPMDSIYESDKITDIFIKHKRSNFLGELIGKVTYYDIYPFEFNRLDFVVVATHNSSFQGAVDTILKRGAELSNIRFVYNSKADSANMIVDVTESKALVEWFFPNGKVQIVDTSGMDTLESIVKKIIKYDENQLSSQSEERSIAFFQPA